MNAFVQVNKVQDHMYRRIRTVEGLKNLTRTRRWQINLWRKYRATDREVIIWRSIQLATVAVLALAAANLLGFLKKPCPVLYCTYCTTLVLLLLTVASRSHNDCLHKVYSYELSDLSSLCKYWSAQVMYQYCSSLILSKLFDQLDSHVHVLGSAVMIFRKKWFHQEQEKKKVSRGTHR